MRAFRSILVIGLAVWTSSLSSFELGGLDPLKITEILDPKDRLNYLQT